MRDSWILGIGDGQGAGAALVDPSGRLAFAVSEERLTRRPRQPGFPVQAIALAMQERLARGGRLEAIAIADRTGRAPFRMFDRWYRSAKNPAGPLDTSAVWAARWSRSAARIWDGVSERSSERFLKQRLEHLGLGGVPFALVDHHDCHAWSAAAGVDDGLVLTMDAYGDGVSCGIYRLERGRSPHPRLRRCRRVPAPHGPAILVAVVKQVLGVADGTLGAIAADGDPHRLLPAFADVLTLRDGLPRLRGDRPLARLARALRGEPAHDVAAAMHAHVTSIVIGVLTAAHRDFGGTALRLAGSLFADVALNREVARAAADLGMASTFVFPAMDDEGLCAGAALAARVGRGGGLLGIDDARVGPLAWDESAPIPVQSPALPITDDAAAVRGALTSGEVVARCTRRMEFGPRALGSRSLFLRPDQPMRAARLNEALGRDPSLPFGVVLPLQDAPRLLAGWSESWDPLTHHMTAALPATDAMRTHAPLAVHRDGTTLARVLRREADPVLHDLLMEMPGHVLVNTSLNRHGEPIACTLQEAEAASVSAEAALLWVG